MKVVYGFKVISTGAFPFSITKINKKQQFLIILKMRFSESLKYEKLSFEVCIQSIIIYCFKILSGGSHYKSAQSIEHNNKSRCCGQR